LWAFIEGGGATIFRDAPYSMIYWLCFERVRPIFENKLYSIDRGGSSSSSSNSINSNSNRNSSSIYSSNRYYASTNFVCGALSGAFAAFITHPMDVIKTKQQLMAEHKPKMPFIERLQHSIKTSGFLSLYKGLALRLAIVYSKWCYNGDCVRSCKAF
jgi:solute carrier family 25, member 39/40